MLMLSYLVGANSKPEFRWFGNERRTRGHNWTMISASWSVYQLSRWLNNPGSPSLLPMPMIRPYPRSPHYSNQPWAPTEPEKMFRADVCREMIEIKTFATPPSLSEKNNSEELQMRSVLRSKKIIKICSAHSCSSHFWEKNFAMVWNALRKSFLSYVLIA